MGPIIIVGAVLLAIAVLAYFAKGLINVVRCVSFIRRKSDEAYQFFNSHPDDWRVFNTPARDVPSDQLEEDVGIPVRKLAGPYQFRVPLLGNQKVTVFGIRKGCIRSFGKKAAEYKKA